VTGLALAVRHPGRLRTLVAHEPPLLTLLPDAEERLASTDENIAIYHREGVGAAWMRFMSDAGYELRGHDALPPPHEPSERELYDSARFFVHELRFTVGHRPDVEALKTGPTRVVVGIGDESGQLLTNRTTAELADLLGIARVRFPGGHTGFIDHPEKFAEILRTVLLED
jgi:pimeloyl-ACP methyl ester carboxylesterase